MIGGGSVGLLGALILKAWGARDVHLAEDTNQLRCETAAAQRMTWRRSIAWPGRSSAEFDLVLDAVGCGHPGQRQGRGVPGGVISPVELQDWLASLDARTLTLQEVTLVGVYTYTDADLRASLAALHDGRLGSLDWIEERPLSRGGEAFSDLDANRTRAARIILRP